MCEFNYYEYRDYIINKFKGLKDFYVSNYDFKEDEIFVCPNCGFTIDRDLNATLNILGLGLKEIGFPDEEVDEIIKEEIKRLRNNEEIRNKFFTY